MSKSSLQKWNDIRVTAGNALIEANYSENLTARAHKVARLIIALVRPDDIELGPFYKVSIDSLKHYLGYHEGKKWGRFLQDLDDIAARLNSEAIDIPTGDKKKYTKAYFIASWTVDLNKRIVEFEISQKLKPYLIQLKSEFTSYLLGNIPKLKSAYSIRMYELLSQYRRIGERTFEVEDLKRKLGCNYDLYGHFKSKALKKAQEDMETHTDLRFEMEEHKAGRKVVELTFYIYPNIPEESVEESPQLSIFDNLPIEDELPEVVGRIIALGIPEATAHQFYQKGFQLIEDSKQREEAEKRVETVSMYFEEKLLLLEKKRNNGNVSSPAGFFIRALKEDWVDKAITMRLKKKTATQKAQQEEQEQDQRNRELAQVRTKICGEIMEENPEILEVAYKGAMSKMGDFGPGLAKGKSPKQLFEEGGFIAAFIESELEALYPERFKKMRQQPSKGDN
ncbi:MAG: replication initiation protein, partial [Bacteroidetes bacterium]|nr:replication initiation protein [Bacteroidota bacterium]